jgi:iron-sulfur cluster repair protein YtfE (RIC family)
MSHDFEDFMAYVTHLRAEHKRLREWLLSIEQQWPMERPCPAEAILNLLDSLSALRGELAHHFEEEERGGCLEEAVSHQPSLSHEATRLEQEHPVLLEQLERMIEKLSAVSSAMESAGTIEKNFRRFAEQLHAHETAENRILEESFGIEVD